MRLIVADDSADSAMRLWNQILAPLEFQLCRRWIELESCQTGDVIILHGAGNTLVEKFENTASQCGIYVVVISGAGFRRRAADPNVYFRRAPVAARALGPDPHFGQSVRRFLRALQDGRLDWSQIEPSAFPAEAYALFVLVHGWLQWPERRARIREEWEALPAAVRDDWIRACASGDGESAALVHPEMFVDLTPGPAEAILRLLQRRMENSYERA